MQQVRPRFARFYKASKRPGIGLILRLLWRDIGSQTRTEFVGSDGIIRGWQAVLDRYKKSYPDKAAMGKLTFSDLEITMLSSDSAYILGKWHLEREKDHPGGVFTLIARKFPGRLAHHS